MITPTIHDRSSVISVHPSVASSTAPSVVLSAPPLAVPVDALSEILRDLRLTGVAYGRCLLADRWGLAFPAQRAARFHVVARGSCWLEHPSRGWMRLRAGDAVLLPHGDAHALSDRPGGAHPSIDTFPRRLVGERYYELAAGVGAPETLLFCGSITLDTPGLHPLMELLPDLLHVADAAGDDPALSVLLDVMAEEVITARVGSATVLTRLAEVVTARLLRAWVLSRAGDTTGWLAALRDPAVGRALLAVHRHPGRVWTLATLAEVAGLSRSTFAERFLALTGIAPAGYVARWRMQLAGVWLRDGQLTVAEIAGRLGYRSESSFSRAFRRVVGVPPGAVRGRPPGPPSPDVAA